MFRIGCHLSSAGGYLAMGQTAVSIGELADLAVELKGSVTGFNAEPLR